MRILSAIIKHKLDNEFKLSKTHGRIFAYQEHICVYLHSLFYLGLDDFDMRKKKILWKNLISSTGKNQIKIYNKLIKYKKKEEQIIIMALNKIEEMRDKDSSPFGRLYRPFTIAILSYERQVNE